MNIVIIKIISLSDIFPRSVSFFSREIIKASSQIGIYLIRPFSQKKF
jgi:hypothetical protein